MPRFPYAAGLALAISALFPAAATAQTAGFVYTLYNIPAAPNMLYGSVLHTDGTLTPLPGFPMATGGNGQQFYPFQALYYDAANSRLYAANAGSNTVSAWTVNNATGALTSMPFSPLALPPVSSSIWGCVATNPSGSVLVVGDGNAARVASYAVSSSAATPAAGSPYFISPALPNSCTFSQDGAFYYTGGGGTGYLGGFSVNQSTGVLTKLPGSPYPEPIEPGLGYQTDSAGRLFAVTAYPDVAHVFTTASGVPTPAAGSPFPHTNSFSLHGLLHPSGYYLTTGQGLGVLRISGSGAATTLTTVGSPVSTGGMSPRLSVLDSLDNLVVTANDLSRNTTVFSFNPATGGVTWLLVTAANSTGTTGHLSGLAFAPFALPPSVITGSATAVTSFTATLNGTANPNGTATTGQFEYGLTTAYGSTTATQSLGFSTSAVAIGGGEIGGLTCNTLYHFRATASNAGGTTSGADATFTTGVCPPTVVTGVAAAVSASGATVNGIVNPNGGVTSAHVDYGLTTAYGSQTSPQNLGSGTASVPLVASIGGLTANTLYHFRVVATNAAGTTTGSDATFLTRQGGDIDGDGRSDVLLRNSANGQTIAWLMNGLSVGNSGFLPTIADTNWEAKRIGDFDGDGKYDLIWRNKVSGQNIVWLMDGLTVANSAFLPTIADTNWEIVGVGDVDGDGKADVIWRNKVSGQNIGWLMNGMTVTNSAFLPTVADTNWQIVGVGDVNGDGKADVLLRNSANGQDIGWLMNGLMVANSAFLPTIADTNWQIVGVGDVNGDGKADVLLRNNANGQDLGWVMDGLMVVNSAFLPTIADTNWEMKAFGDIDGDGKSDVIWRNKVTGQHIGWLMNGLTVVNSAFLPTIADTNWQIVGPR